MPSLRSRPRPELSELLATPCLPCRENHLKCDRLTPKCGRCATTGRECKLAFKFKAAKCSAFEKTQPWLKTPKHLTYIDENRHLALEASDYDSPGSGPEAAASPTLANREEDSRSDRSCLEMEADTVLHPDVVTSPSEEYRDDGYSASTGVTFSNNPETAQTEASTKSATSPFSHGHLSLLGNGQLPTPPRTHSDISTLPLANKTEARLFRHYIQRLAVCLDVCDAFRNFELVVPERANSCPTLLKAIFALASRHLSQTGDFDPLASNRYHDECLAYLIPMLDHASAGLSDENLFAATIILRMLEEIDAPILGQDNCGHLLGIHAFVNVGEQYMVPGSLSAACYWVGLRQEIYSSMIEQSRVKMNLDHFLVDRSVEPADDYTWSNRAVVNLADVLNFCFAESNAAQWSALNEQCTRWKHSRPKSFDPYYYREREEPDEAFPEIWHHSACHVIGIQHHILAQLFLAQFDPTIPRVGTRRGAAVKRSMKRIEHLMRQLCGIGVSNQWTPPAMFTASMGIAMFGDRFEDKLDQDAMVDILKKTEADHARPTKTVQQQLMRVWGWIPSYEDG